MSASELARIEAKARGWDWIAEECRRLKAEMQAAREAAETRTRGTLDTTSHQE